MLLRLSPFFTSWLRPWFWLAEPVLAGAGAAVAAPTVRQRLFETGNFPVGSTPAELKDFVAKEIASWGEVVRASGVRIE